MTDQEINIAITEACGWKRAKQYDYMEAFPPSNKGHFFYEKDGQLKRDTELPDHCHDLNAMQSALNYQSQGFNDKFAINLELRAKRLGKHIHQLMAQDWAEEFLRTLGKWKE